MNKLTKVQPKEKLVAWRGLSFIEDTSDFYRELADKYHLGMIEFIRACVYIAIDHTSHEAFDALMKAYIQDQVKIPTKK